VPAHAARGVGRGLTPSVTLVTPPSHLRYGLAQGWAFVLPRSPLPWSSSRTQQLSSSLSARTTLRRSARNHLSTFHCSALHARKCRRSCGGRAALHCPACVRGVGGVGVGGGGSSTAPPCERGGGQEGSAQCERGGGPCVLLRGPGPLPNVVYTLLALPERLTGAPNWSA
jgi:hypothetical protein